MGDSHRGYRHLTGYGPIRLLCAVLGVFSTIAASLLPLLAPAMIVFFVACVCVGFCGASFAPDGPCVVSPEGYVLSYSFAFRNATSGASFGKSPPAVGLCGSAHPVRARRVSPPFSSSCSLLPHHLGGGGTLADEVAPISGLGQSDPANPTQFVVGQNDTVVDSGGLHVLRDVESTCTPGFSIGPVWSPKFWAG